MTRAQGPVAGGEVDPVGDRRVGHAGPGPYPALHIGTVRRTRRLHEVDGLVAAQAVEHVLTATGQVDGGYVALVVALVTGIPRIGGIEIRVPVLGGAHGQGR